MLKEKKVVNFIEIFLNHFVNIDKLKKPTEKYDFIFPWGFGHQMLDNAILWTWTLRAAGLGGLNFSCSQWSHWTTVSECVIFADFLPPSCLSTHLRPEQTLPSLLIRCIWSALDETTSTRYSEACKNYEQIKSKICPFQRSEDGEPQAWRRFEFLLHLFVSLISSTDIQGGSETNFLNYII